MMTSIRYRLIPVAALIAIAAACGPRPASIEVKPPKLLLFGVGKVKDLDVRVFDRGHKELSDVTVVASSSNPAVVEATDRGHLIAKKAGKSMVTITAEKLTSTIPVVVFEATRLDINPAVLTLVGPPGITARPDVSGKTADGKPAPVPTLVWKSRDPKIASVAQDGTIMSVAPGKTTVTADVGDLSVEVDVNIIVKNISRLEIHPATAIVRVGETQAFTIQAYDETGAVVPEAAAAFSTENSAVVRLTPHGAATGVAPGTAVVKASIGSRVATATLLVN